MIDKINGYNTRTTPHPGKIKNLNVTPHLVPINNSSRYRRRRSNHRDSDNKYIDLRGGNAGFSKEIVESTKDDIVDLRKRIGKIRGFFGAHDDISWAVSFLPDARLHHCLEQKLVLLDPQIFVPQNEFPTCFGVEFHVIRSFVTLVSYNVTALASHFRKQFQEEEHHHAIKKH
ncbi:hypothetical protein GQ457_14G023040 [Hibiscus cannabinus]